MEIIGKISKGSRMDQVYIPKNRVGFSVGSYVVLKPLLIEEDVKKPYFYGIDSIGEIKLKIINEIFGVMDKLIENYENIIIAGSFLDKGFNFNDIDVILVSNNKLNMENVKKSVEDKLRINIHLILLSSKGFGKGMETDPLYQMMLSKCVAKKRFVFKVKYKINYKILDLHLLKSELLIINYDYLTGNEKYYLVRNMISIFLFLNHRKVSKEIVDREIRKSFNLKNINIIKHNLIEDKREFLKKYKRIYKNLFNKIMKGIKSGTKQK